LQGKQERHQQNLQQNILPKIKQTQQQIMKERHKKEI
jgi:hypothetical protein